VARAAAGRCCRTDATVVVPETESVTMSCRSRTTGRWMRTKLGMDARDRNGTRAGPAPAPHIHCQLVSTHIDRISVCRAPC
jgi:hypothetical protein